MLASEFAPWQHTGRNGQEAYRKEQVDILDEVEQIVPRAVLRCRRVVGQVGLDCGEYNACQNKYDAGIPA